MNRPRCNPLSRTGLTVNQNGKIGPGHLLDLRLHRPERRAFADELPGGTATRSESLVQSFYSWILGYRQCNRNLLRVVQIAIYRIDAQDIGTRFQLRVFSLRLATLMPFLLLPLQSIPEHEVRSHVDRAPA